MTKKIFSLQLIFLLLSIGSFAQIQTEVYNKHSVRPIKKDDQMFKRSIWWRIDLRQKINVGFFAENNEITRLIVNAVKKGVIKPFRDDSLNKRLPLQEFLERLQLPIVDEIEELDNFDDDDLWEEEGNKKMIDHVDDPEEYLPRQLFVLELKEDRIFDKRRSRMYHDILAITIIIPGSQTLNGLNMVLASFSYKELVNDLFKNNPNAIWYNRQNAAEHRNLEHAFDLRLFNGLLVKFENPKDRTITDIYGAGRKGLIKSEQTLHKMIEEEALLWSY